MNGKDLLITLGDISHKYYDEAENETIESSHKTLRRPLLIAAIVALMLFLMGCAVVYALRLQDMSIGKETYTQSFDDKGRAIEPVEKTRDIITIYGHSGDAIQQALTEWFAFLETYDPDGELLDNIPDHPEIPNLYEYNYDCYTLDMAAKVDEIAEKYDLKLLEECLVFQAWQSDIFAEETGIESFVLPDSGAEVSRLSGTFYPPYNFNVDIDLKVEGIDTKLWITVLYARKDYFPEDYPGGTDLSLYEQWDYTASDGTALLLALNNKGHGYVVAELENAMMILSMDGNFSMSAYPEKDEIMTKEQLEAVAAVFDYSIQPQILDRSSVAEQLEESNKAHEAENVYVPEAYGSFEEYLKKTITVLREGRQYTFFDLTGDGTEELLLGMDGAITYWASIQNGEITEHHAIGGYLCEGYVVESYHDGGKKDNYENRSYTTSLKDGAWYDPEGNGTMIVHLLRVGNAWYQTTPDDPYEEKEISDQEAKTIIAKYPRIQLDWKPITEYPLNEDGYTFGDYLEEQDVRVSDEELLEIYKDRLNNMEDMYYSHYRILDINGDGVDDLLLKGEDDALIGNTDFYWNAVTYRYGRVVSLVHDFYLCEDGVLEKTSTRFDLSPGVEINGKQFMRCDGLETEEYEFVAWNKATASWQGDWRGEIPMTEEEANAILEKYPRIDQGMRPISELLE